MEGRFQIGKNGLSKGVIEAINGMLKTHKRLRISTLKSATRDKDALRQMADDLVKGLNYKTSYLILGFTIILKRNAATPLTKIE